MTEYKDTESMITNYLKTNLHVSPLIKIRTCLNNLRCASSKTIDHSKDLQRVTHCWLQIAQLFALVPELFNSSVSVNTNFWVQVLLIVHMMFVPHPVCIPELCLCRGPCINRRFYHWCHW